MADRYYYYFFHYYYYYYYYCHINKLLKPEHEYKRLESNSILYRKIFLQSIQSET
jgi:hypothetical protein